MLQKRCKKKTLMTRSLGGFELNVIAIAKNGGTMQRNVTGGATTMRKNQYVTIKPSLVFLKSKVNRLHFWCRRPESFCSMLQFALFNVRNCYVK